MLLKAILLHCGIPEDKLSQVYVILYDAVVSTCPDDNTSPYYPLTPATVDYTENFTTSLHCSDAAEPDVVTIYFTSNRMSVGEVTVWTICG